MVRFSNIATRLRVIGALVIIFLLAAGSLYLASTLLVQAQFSKIEMKDTQKQTAVAVDALNNRINQLAVKNSDWSSWDDTYAFIVNHNPAYVKSNLQTASLANLDINFMLFYDIHHHLVATKGLDADGNELALPTALLDDFGPTSTLFSDNETAVHKGVLNLPDNPLLFAARPILTSDGNGPSRGTVVFAEYLSSEQVQQIADLTHLNVTYYRNSSLPASTSPLLPTSATAASVHALAPNQIAGYQQINDVFGRPALVARVVLPRDAFLEAQRSLLYFVSIVAIVTLLALFITLYIANQLLARDNVIRLKNEFFSMASHELRTPLTAIRGNASLLQRIYGSKNDPEFSSLTSDIREASNRLLRLVTNFLDAARIEQGKVPINLGLTDLRTTISAVLQEMQGIANDKHIQLRTELPPQLPTVWADADRLKQIIYNLIGNAAKFTDSGSITLAAEIRGDFVCVLVRDTGRGISPQDQKTLFHEFQQTRASDSSRGTGLGLYISKTLVELMGGKIRLESSEIGQGTTLSFTVPIAAAEQIKPHTKTA